jgi:hypothetical protein
MNTVDYVTALNSTHQLIDSAWNIFIFVHIAFLGGIYSLSRPLSVIEKLVALCLYVFFAYMNSGSLVYSYDLYRSLVVDIIPNIDTSYKLTGNLLSGQTSDSFFYKVYAVHVLAGFLFCSLIIFCDKLILKNRSKE